MLKRVLRSAGLVMVVALLAATMASAAAPPPPGGGTNTLRVYGKAGELAPMPYTTYQGPFDLTSFEAPPKDFVVFNPALLRKMDQDAHGQFGRFFGYIKAGNQDAHQKVHARMWYQPSYPEPRGKTSPMVPDAIKAYTADVVLEYTYMLLSDRTLNPVAGTAGNTRMAFPLAGFHVDDPNDPPGLDSYDVHGDGHPDIMQVDVITGTDFGGPQNTIWVSAQGTTGANPNLYEGDTIQMFDYMVEVVEAPTQNDRKVRLEFSYVGVAKNERDFIGRVTLFSGDYASVEARNGPPRLNQDPIPVERPFWVTVDVIGTGYVKLTAHRILQAGESFFVDGAEYDVAGIYVTDEGRLKYITIRNPIPKGTEPVEIRRLTVFKTPLRQGQDAWVLPPFNYVHDMIDDINIPTRVGWPFFPPLPDAQFPDNVTESETCLGPLGFVYGCDSNIHRDFNTILERMIEDVDPLIGISWQEQTKEGRFDTSLMEEKFTEAGDLARYLEIGEELTLYDTWSFGEVKPVWIGWWPGWTVDEHTRLGLWRAEREFCDADADGLVDPSSVNAYVNGVQVPVLLAGNYDDNGYVLLDSAAFVDLGKYPNATVTLDYCYIDVIGGQYWQWINIETHPWNFTEFVLPQRPDKPTTPPYDKGDYILVSSWITEDDVRMKFVFDPEIGMIHAADIYVNDAEYNSIFKGVDANTLRVYGRDDVNAAFPYTRADGPFNIGNENWEKPGKDFVVFNPAFLDGWRYPIKAGNWDANQKVHLRMWYVPEYLEPAGYTEPMVPCDEKVSNYALYGDGDIVLEYTFILLDKQTNDPVGGWGQQTKMMFPMAGFHPDITTDPIGLDSFDVNDDRQDNIMSIEAVFPNFDAEQGTGNAVVVSPEGFMGGDLEIGVGETIQFLDFAITLDGIAGPQSKADLRVDYVGWQKNIAEYIGNVQLWQRNSEDPDAFTDAALVTFGSDTEGKSIIRVGDKDNPSFWTPGDWGFSDQAAPVSSPFFFFVEYVGTEVVEVKPYRWLLEGETFFVDGAEYDVAKIHVVDVYDEHNVQHDGVKYITIRNPIPKCSEAPCQDIQIPILTRYKSRVLPYPEMLPVLPPFDRQHDIVDDVNIPELFQGIPDAQLWDNVLGEGFFGPVFPPGSGLQWGEASLIHELFNTIEKRLVADQAALAIGWMEEAKETRFDTNLLEEKFTKPWCGPETRFKTDTLSYIEDATTPYGWYGYTTYEIEEVRNVTVDGVHVPVLGIGKGGKAVLLEQKFAHLDPVIEYDYLTGDEVCTGQEWRWINIETMPWHYTEFVLPEIDEAAPLEDLGFIGDYILVSSFVTQDGVRAKFSYDATDGTGIYVNHCLSELGITSLTANPMVVPLGVPIEFEATVTGMPTKYVWDFGGAGELTAGGQETGTFVFSEPGQFQVFLTVSDECLTRSAFVNVEVEVLNADVNKDGVVDFQDLLEVLRHWGNNYMQDDWAEHEHADVNDDGFINIFDILLMLQVLLS